MVALNPEHAQLLDQAGFGPERIAQTIVELTTASREANERWIPSLRGRTEIEHLPAFATADDVLVLVAGGSGLYSTVFPTWCAGPNSNRAVSVAFDPAPVCELPAFDGSASRTS